MYISYFIGHIKQQTPQPKPQPHFHFFFLFWCSIIQQPLKCCCSPLTLFLCFFLFLEVSDMEPAFRGIPMLPGCDHKLEAENICCCRGWTDHVGVKVWEKYSIFWFRCVKNGVRNNRLWLVIVEWWSNEDGCGWKEKKMKR